MRLNKYLALHTSLSRRGADAAIAAGRIKINGAVATLGQTASETDHVTLDNSPINTSVTYTTIILNKPVGYVCSRRGQGSQTIYDLLPTELHHLESVGRLDKDSSGLLLMTNDGQLANQLTHPRYQKIKRYEITLGTPLQPLHQQMINDYGLQLEDGLSKLALHKKNDSATEYEVTMHEGRNRQIRRTFAALGYRITRLHRTHFGDYQLADLKPGDFQKLP